MSITSDLAQELVRISVDLDQLYNDLVSNGQYGLANQVSQTESNLKVAATNLYSMDLDNEINAVAGAAQKLTTLTADLTASEAKIAASQARVAAVSGIVSSVLSVVGDLGAHNIGGAVAAADQAISLMNKF
jgi:paraquat-inducible protein B